MRAFEIAVALCACVVSLPSEAQMRKDLTQAEVDSINEALQTHAKAALAKDWNTVASLYAEDAIYNPPNEPPLKGRTAIRGRLERYPPLTAFKLSSVKVEGRDGLAYVVGAYEATVAGPGPGMPIKDTGRFVHIYHRQPDGRWLIVVDIFSSELAATPRPQ
jgi:ketosteroid isomerase-like protein